MDDANEIEVARKIQEIKSQKSTAEMRLGFKDGVLRSGKVEYTFLK